MRVPDESSSVRILLASSDIDVIETFCHFAQQMAIHVESCCDADSATRKLCHAKFEGVVVDLVCDGAPALLKKLHTLTSNKTAVSFAIAGEGHQGIDSCSADATFVLERPLLPAHAHRVLKAAYPLIVRERRRYFRCPLQVSVFVTRQGEPEFTVTSLNVSESGICLNSPRSLQVGDHLRLSLCLPGNADSLNLTGEVCWSEALGRVGIKFMSVNKNAAKALSQWLSDRLVQNAPETSRMQPSIEPVCDR
jgi:hypothetical protein